MPNVICDTAFISKDVIVGDGNFFGPNVYIGPGVVIGNNNQFIAHSVIGSPAQHRTAESMKGVVIGDDNVIREFVTVNNPIESQTYIGSDCYLMKGAHVAHDCIIEDHVTLCNDVNLAGHVIVMCYATLGLGCQIHQYQVLGAASMLGMGTIVPRETLVRPGMKYIGNPAVEIGQNEVGLERHNLSKLWLDKQHKRWCQIDLRTSAL